MNMLDRIFGKKSRTAAVIAAEISNQRAAIAESRTRIVKAQADRQAAIEAFDDAKHQAADDAIAAAGRDIERREHALGLLAPAHAEQADREAREEHRREVAEAAHADAALAKRIQAEYGLAASTIAALLQAIEASEARRRRLKARGKDLGEPTEYAGPESFRRPFPVEYRISWVDPEAGHSTRGTPEQAPEGAIRWKGDVPVSNRPDVSVKTKGGERPVSLLHTVGYIPALHSDEPAYHRGLSGQH